jgi:ABC-2 type transport system ATP-binding protein
MSRVLALVGALTLLLAAPASAFTKKAMTFDVKTGPDGTTPCKVNADLYTPDGVSRANPAPAVMGTNGFGGSKSDFTTLAGAYASRGYVFLAYSGLGFGGSGCKIQLDDPDWDGKAGSQLVSFLGKQDFVVKDGPGDPRVGMIGGSYGGQIQFAIAGVDKRMDAIVPQITWNDLSYSLTPNNTDISGVTYSTPGVVKLDWPVLFFGLGVGQGFQHAIQDGDPSHIGSCPNFDDRVCPGLVQSAARGYQDDATLALLRHASVSSYMSRIRIPTFLAQGQSDTLFDQQEAVATYRALRAQHTPVKMLWRSAGHSGGDLGDQESSDANPEIAYESRMELEWFDWYLKGVGDPPTLDFTFVRDWALPKTGDAAAAVGQTRSYPGGADRTLYLSGSDALTGSRAGVTAGTASMAAVPGAPTGTGGGFVDTGGNDAQGTSVAFATAPLGDDTDVVGIPRLTAKVDAPTFAASQSADPLSKLVLFAKLYDLAPDGSRTLPRNLLSAVRVGDVTKPVTIELPGISYRFAKGHRLQLVLSTSDLQYRGNSLAGPVSIVADPAAPSTLTIPVLGAQTGPSGSGPNGTTPFAAPPGSPPAQKPGAGGPHRAGSAAALPAAKRCASRRRFRIHLRRGLRSATVVVNGKRVRVVRGKRLRAPVDLRGLPKGTFRVTVTGRNARGRLVRSARSYHTCVAKKKKKQ